jgi:hypothetical protein
VQKRREIQTMAQVGKLKVNISTRSQSSSKQTRQAEGKKRRGNVNVIIASETKIPDQSNKGGGNASPDRSLRPITAVVPDQSAKTGRY